MSYQLNREEKWDQPTTFLLGCLCNRVVCNSWSLVYLCYITYRSMLLRLNVSAQFLWSVSQTIQHWLSFAYVPHENSSLLRCSALAALSLHHCCQYIKFLGTSGQTNCSAGWLIFSDVTRVTKHLRLLKPHTHSQPVNISSCPCVQPSALERKRN